jgi:glycosyltransferase involved in cell wall biosynthesis/tetratricopeptide (TPR) repeat protein
MTDREDTPWYPTARLFRQSRADDWDEVLARVAAALALLANNGRRDPIPQTDGALSAPVSFGELIDKITILRIKSERIADPGKLANVRRELDLLTEVRRHSACNAHDIREFERELERVNQQLWDIEERIRDCERRADFGPEFVDLARAVYKTNDRRAELKRRINDVAGSELIEEKSYHPSQPAGGDDSLVTRVEEQAADPMVAPPERQVAGFSRLLDRAMALHQQDKLAEAERLYLTILAAQPDHPDATHLLGLLRHQQGRDLEALELLGSVLKQNPDAAAALANQGVVLHRLGRRQEAVASYNRALAIRPDDSKALCNRGVCLQELGRIEEAVASYDRALALKPDYPDARNNHDICRRALDRPKGLPALQPVIVPANLIDNRVIFNGQISNYFGWGVVGLNLLLSWWKIEGPSLLTSVGFAESDLALNPFERTRLRPALEQSRALQSWLCAGAGGCLDVPVPVLHTLGNGFGDGRSRVQLSGKPNVGLIVCESTEFPREARQRAKAYELMVAASNWNREILEHAGLGPTEVVFQGVDPSHFHPGPRAGWFGDRFTVFSGGKLEFRKAQDLVLLAFRAFAQRHPEALLVTAWSSPFPQFARSVEVNQAIGPVCFQPDGKVDAKAWACANGINREQVLDLGAVPNAELPRLYREMDVALFPNRCEGGTNLVAMECMACGVPLVISNNTGHLDLIAPDRCVPLVRQTAVPGADHLGWGESNVEEIVEALETVWRDREVARALGSRGAQFMRRLTWDEMARRLAEILQPYLTRSNSNTWFRKHACSG